MKAVIKYNKNTLLAICRSSEAAGGVRSNCVEFFGSFCRYKKNEENGNIRAVQGNNGVAIQSTQYYPYGMSYQDRVFGQEKQPYLFNGKELDNISGLNWYDFSARYYDDVLGRFTTPDPMAEKYYSISPYAAFGGNPLRFVDPSGMRALDFQNEDWYEHDNENGTTSTVWRDDNAKTITIDDQVYNNIGEDYTVPTADISQLVHYHQSNVTGVTDLKSDEGGKYSMIAAGIAGTLSSSLAGMKYSENLWGGGYWIGKNGKMYEMSLLEAGTKGRFFYQNSANIAKSSTALLRGVGNALSWLTTGYSLFEFKKNPNWENGIDLGIGVGGLIYWPVGLIGSGSYLEWQYNNEIHRYRVDRIYEIENSGKSQWEKYLERQALPTTYNPSWPY